jgi:predicted ATPase
MFALHVLRAPANFAHQTLCTFDVDPEAPVEVRVHWTDPAAVYQVQWQSGRGGSGSWLKPLGIASNLPDRIRQARSAEMHRFTPYAFEPSAIAAPVPLQPSIELGADGSNLAGVLDRLRDLAPERFERLNAEIHASLPEFDRVLFDTPAQGQRSFLLRSSRAHHRVPASELSHGTLLVLAILTLAHLPDPPPIVSIEEPDRGIHPRLLRDVRDAMYRLAYPQQFGEPRPPTQVIATTHSPYLLDLYRDHPEEIVIAQRDASGARFERLTERTELADVLRETHLGDAWYSGVLGGVPAEE